MDRTRLLVFSALFLPLFLPSGDASAQTIIHVEGLDAARLRAAIVGLVPGSEDLLKSQSLLKALARPRIGRRLLTDQNREAFKFELQAAARSVGAKRVILARTLKRDAFWLLAYLVDEDRIVLDERGKQSTLANTLAGFWPGTPRGPAVGNSPEPGAADPDSDRPADWSDDDKDGEEDGFDELGGARKPRGDVDKRGSGGDDKDEHADKDKDKDKATDKVEPTPEGGREWLTANLFGGLLGRHLEYTGRGSDNVRPHGADGVLFVGVRAVAFPLDPLMGGLMGDFGLALEYRQALPFNTEMRNPKADLDTSIAGLRVDLLMRIALEPIELRPTLGFGMERIVFETADSNVANLVPQATYSFVHVGAAASWRPGPFDFSGRAGICLPVGLGKIGAEYFPNASAIGFDVGATVSYFFVDWLSVDGAVDLTFFSYALGSTIRDPYVAESATDQLLVARLGLSYHYGQPTVVVKDERNEDVGYDYY
ncbi:MAG: hypothetical protein A2341_15880 [Deltaproteobacteria bacterium RIFOXYB12_FULL_58_9]|nr:MAG: hypothetical protein A2341_15880 [Deltaproteobacteria bacterium RIFOXYB12_FULL_58_9]